MRDPFCQPAGALLLCSVVDANALQYSWSTWQLRSQCNYGGTGHKLLGGDVKQAVLFVIVANAGAGRLRRPDGTSMGWHLVSVDGAMGWIELPFFGLGWETGTYAGVRVRRIA